MTLRTESAHCLAVLEAEYRRAFSAYAAAVRHMQGVESQPWRDPFAIQEATRRVHDAESEYRERRNALASALTARSNEMAGVCELLCEP